MSLIASNSLSDLEKIKAARGELEIANLIKAKAAGTRRYGVTT